MADAVIVNDTSQNLSSLDESSSSQSNKSYFGRLTDSIRSFITPSIVSNAFSATKNRQTLQPRRNLSNSSTNSQACLTIPKFELSDYQTLSNCKSTGSNVVSTSTDTDDLISEKGKRLSSKQLVSSQKNHTASFKLFGGVGNANTNDTGSDVESVTTSGVSSLLPHCGARMENRRNLWSTADWSDMYAKDATSASNGVKRRLCETASQRECKRPCFNLSIFGSRSINIDGMQTSESYASAVNGETYRQSPFYPGKTTFGGSSNRRHNSTSLTTATPLRFEVQRRGFNNTSSTFSTSVPSAPAAGYGYDNCVMSNTTRNILEALDRLSAPANDVGRIPVGAESFSTVRSTRSMHHHPYRAAAQRRLLRRQQPPPPTEARVIVQPLVSNASKVSQLEPVTSPLTDTIEKPIFNFAVPVERANITQFQVASPPTSLFSFAVPQKAGCTTTSVSLKNDSSVNFHPKLKAKSSVISTVSAPVEIRTGSVTDFLAASGAATTAPLKKDARDSGSALAKLTAAVESQWLCNACESRNLPAAMLCSGCEAPRGSKTPLVVRSSENVPSNIGSIAKSIAPSFLSTSSPMSAVFGKLATQQNNKDVLSWKCINCLVANQLSVSICSSCGSPRHSTEPIAINSSQKSDASAAVSWICACCSTKNEPQHSRCTSCDVERLPVTKPATIVPQPASKSAWSCPTCMVDNSSDKSRCVCCETPQPGSDDKTNKNSALQFNTTHNLTSALNSGIKFGVPSSSNVGDLKFGSTVTPNTAGLFSLSGCVKFGTAVIASTIPDTVNTVKPNSLNCTSSTDTPSQNGSKWSCPTCLVDNTSDKARCVCCEADRPVITAPCGVVPLSVVSLGMSSQVSQQPLIFNSSLPAKSVTSFSGSHLEKRFGNGIAAKENDGSLNSFGNQSSTDIKLNATSIEKSTSNDTVSSRVGSDLNSIAGSFQSAASKFAFGETKSTAENSQFVNTPVVNTASSETGEVKSTLFQFGNNSASTHSVASGFGSLEPKPRIESFQFGNNASSVSTAPTGRFTSGETKSIMGNFQFGNNSTTNAAVFAGGLASGETKSVMGNFQFGNNSMNNSSASTSGFAPQETKSCTSASSAAPFSFKNCNSVAGEASNIGINATTSVPSNTFSLGSTKSASDGAVFQFGNKLNNAPNDAFANQAGVSGAALPNTASVATPFQFGNNSAVNSTGSGSGFSFGNSKSTSNSGLFQFGNNSNNVPINALANQAGVPGAALPNAMSGNVGMAATSPFQFGNNTASTVSGSGFSFGNSKSANNPGLFQFGSNSNNVPIDALTNQAGVPGAALPNALSGKGGMAVTAPFQFGSNSAVNTPVSGTVFSFGNSKSASNPGLFQFGNNSNNVPIDALTNQAGMPGAALPNARLGNNMFDVTNTSKRLFKKATRRTKT